MKWVCLHQKTRKNRKSLESKSFCNTGNSGKWERAGRQEEERGEGGGSQGQGDLCIPHSENHIKTGHPEYLFTDAVFSEFGVVPEDELVRLRRGKMGYKGAGERGREK